MQVIAEKSTKASDEVEIMGNSDPNNPVYRIAEEMPIFPGGEGELLKYINHNIKYPVDAQKEKVEGRVIASFTVNVDGSLSDYKIVRGVILSFIILC